MAMRNQSYKSIRAKVRARLAAIGIGIVVAVAPLGSHAETFDIRTGAWEVTTTSAIAGMPIPKKVLDEMPPAQRAKMEQAMHARAAKPSTHTHRQCVTKEDLIRSRMLKSEDTKCTTKVIAQSSRSLEIEETCPPPEASKTHVKFDAKSSESYVATMERAQGEGKVHIEMTGRWLAATCQKGVDD